jgi:hypothetical protein
MGARVVVRGPRLRQRTKIAIDIGRDRSGEGFVIVREEEYERWACEYPTHYTSPFSRLSGAARSVLLTPSIERKVFGPVSASYSTCIQFGFL